MGRRVPARVVAVAGWPTLAAVEQRRHQRRSSFSQWHEPRAELPPDRRTAQVLQRQFGWRPPAGGLPRARADFIGGGQGFFPPQFDVQAQPIPIDMVDALIAESQASLPFNLSL